MASIAGGPDRPLAPHSHTRMTTLSLLAIKTLPLQNLLLAQAEGEGRGYSISWAVILLSVVLGLIVALKPAKREDEVKSAVED